MKVRQAESASASRRVASIETLEGRRLMSAQPNFASFSSDAGLIGAGFGGASPTSDNTLRLTSGKQYQAHAVWWGTKVGVDSFTSDFSFKADSNPDSADGMTFTIQGINAKQLGTNGYHLGYTGIDRSVALAFNIWNDGSFGSQFGFVNDGHVPVTDTSLSPIDLHNGDTYNAVVTYDGMTLSVTLTDAANPQETFTQSEQINIPAMVGGDSAYVGFTAATGDDVSTQEVTSWTYSGTANAPVVTTAAEAVPNLVTGQTTTLSAMGSDPVGDDAIDYTWTTLTRPPGARALTFSSTNGTAGGSSLTARFFKAGRYTFRCTLTNSAGKKSTTDVSVVVQQTATSLRLTPHIKKLKLNQQVQFSGVVVDQFGHAMLSQPAITYSIQTGIGTIDPTTGLFEATDVQGHLVIAASGDGLEGTVGATIELP